MQKAHILILDEMPQGIERLKQYLITKGYEASHARNLHEAFQHAKAKRPDVIVVGDNFHKRNGFEICEELRSESDTCYANILLLVSAVDRSVQEQARVAGVNDVVEKNIDEQSFLKHIETLLNQV